MSRICSIEGCNESHDAKGYCHQHYKRWKLHGDPLVVKQAARGSGWIHKKGYRFITVDGRSVAEHVFVAEKALGHRLPKGVIVHHVDENRTNNRNGNLVICPDNKYHRELHVRLNALKASGHADWRKCPFCHEYDDTENMRGEKSGRFVHRECSRIARNASYANRRNACQ